MVLGRRSVMVSTPHPNLPDESAPLVPELFVRDVTASVAFYRDRLRFSVIERHSDFAIIAFGSAFLLLADSSLYKPSPDRLVERRGAGIDLRLMVDDADVHYREFLTAGVEIIDPIADRDYGLRDFIICDLDGYRLRYATRPVPNESERRGD